MTNLIDKVSDLLPHLEKNGRVFLFGLFERDDAPNKWDVVVSSDLGDRDRRELVRELSKHLVPALSRDELQSISRIAVIPSQEPAVLALTKSVQVLAGRTELQNCDFMGLPVKRAFLFRSVIPIEDREPHVLTSAS